MRPKKIQIFIVIFKSYLWLSVYIFRPLAGAWILKIAQKLTHIYVKRLYKDWNLFKSKNLCPELMRFGPNVPKGTFFIHAKQNLGSLNWIAFLKN